MSPIRRRKGKPPLSISPDNLPGGIVGTPYDQAFTASGGPPPYTYSYDGAFPPGLSLSTDGVISGTPTVAGSSSFTVTVTDKKSNSGSQPYTIDIAAAEQPPIEQPPIEPLTFPASRGHQARLFERNYVVPITAMGRKYVVVGGGGGPTGLTQQMQLDSSVTASMDTTTNPGVVTTWTDQVGPPYTFVQSGPAKPTYPGTSQNGRTTCRFDLSNATSMKCTAVAVAAPLVVFTVLSMPTMPASGHSYYFYDDTLGTSRIALFVDNTQKWNIFTGSTVVTSAAASATTGWLVTAHYLDAAGNSTLYLNQGVTAEISNQSTGVASFVAGNGMTIGGRYNNNGTDFIDSTIGEMRIYSGTPAGLGTSGGDIGTIISSLRTKWGF